MKNRGICLVLASVLLAGCTTLSSQSETRTISNTDAIKGIQYSLPILQYEIKITRTLAQCEEKIAPGSDKMRSALRFTVKAEATPVFVPGERFTVDYEKLAGFTKISSFAIENYPSGTLKSVNASAEDRSAEIISGGAKAAFGIAKLVMGVPGISAAQGVTESDDMMLACAKGTQGLLDEVKTTSASLKTEVDALAVITARVTTLTERAAADSLNDAGKDELLRKLGQQKAAAEKVADAQTAADKAKAAVSMTTSERSPASLSSGVSGYLELGGTDLARLQKLLVLQAATDASREDGTFCGSSSLRDCLADQLQANWRLESLTELPKATIADVKKGAVGTTVAQNGLFVRPPEPGRLLVCRRLKDSNSRCSTTAKELLLATPDALVPQLGQLRYLPFRNEMFQNNSLVISLRENGSVEKFEYKDLKARGEVAANLAGDLATQALTFADALRKSKEAEKAAELAEAKLDRETQIALLQYEIDTLTKEQQRSALEDTRVAILQQEINRITKEKELEKLVQPPEISELATINAEENLSNARTALLRAQRAERKAREELND